MSEMTVPLLSFKDDIFNMAMFVRCELSESDALPSATVYFVSTPPLYYRGQEAREAYEFFAAAERAYKDLIVAISMAHNQAVADQSRVIAPGSARGQ